MFKLVVLSALVALVAAKPHVLSPLAYSSVAVAGPSVAVPLATSHQYRTDVVSKPVVATYASAPVIAAAPLVHAAPVVQQTVVAAPVALSSAVSHQSRVDVHSGLVAAPVHAAYAAPIHAAYAAPIHAAYAAPIHAAYAAPAVHAW